MPPHPTSPCHWLIGSLFVSPLGLWTAPLAASEVALDVGHTLSQPGATSARGRPEFAFNAVLAGHLAEELQARGLAVRPINFDGRIESLAARPLQAAGADFFLSIHHDSVHADLLHAWEWRGTLQTYTDGYAGFALFVSHDNPDLPTSLNCASAIGARLRRTGFAAAWHHAAPLAGKARQPADLLNGVYYYDNLVVLHRTTVPAVLFEAGVIKHRAEELALLDRRRQARMADAIATGIAACLYPRGISRRDSPAATAASASQGNHHR